MRIVRSERGIPVRLTDERWRHIVDRHPEMANLKEEALHTIAEPDLIQTGDAGELLAITLQADTPFGEKYVVVSYRELTGENDGFVITAYLTRRPSTRRKVLWSRAR